MVFQGTPQAHTSTQPTPSPFAYIILASTEQESKLAVANVSLYNYANLLPFSVYTVSIGDVQTQAFIFPANKPKDL